MSAGFVVNEFELLDSVKIKHAGGEVDVTAIMALCSIKEDFEYEEVRAQMVVMDSSGALDAIEFDGTETFKISFSSTQEDDKIISLLFRIYKVDYKIDEEKTDYFDA